MPTPHRIRKVNDNGNNTLALVTDTKSRKEFRVVKLGTEHIGFVFDKDDIVKVPIWFFFMVARGTRDAENKLLNG